MHHNTLNEVSEILNHMVPTELSRLILTFNVGLKNERENYQRVIESIPAYVPKVVYVSIKRNFYQRFDMFGFENSRVRADGYYEFEAIKREGELFDGWRNVIMLYSMRQYDERLNVQAMKRRRLC